MLETELRKYSCISSALRRHALTKKAGLIGRTAKRVGARVGASAILNPMKTLTGVAGGVATVGTYRSVRNRLSPEAHRAVLGMPPP